MLVVTLYLVWILSQVDTTRACGSDYPVAFMCEANVVYGSGVALDVRTAASSGYTSCKCMLTSNVTGIMIDFVDNPNVTDCGTQLDLFFEDISMQLKCGVPAGPQYTTGSTAHITYTRITTVDTIDSEYCLIFSANKTDINITLSCVVDDQTTPDGNALSSVSQSPSTHSTTSSDDTTGTSTKNNTSSDFTTGTPTQTTTSSDNTMGTTTQSTTLSDDTTGTTTQRTTSSDNTTGTTTQSTTSSDDTTGTTTQRTTSSDNTTGTTTQRTTSSDNTTGTTTQSTTSSDNTTGTTTQSTTSSDDTTGTTTQNTTSSDNTTGTPTQSTTSSDNTTGTTTQSTTASDNTTGTTTQSTTSSDNTTRTTTHITTSSDNTTGTPTQSTTSSDKTTRTTTQSTTSSDNTTGTTTQSTSSSDSTTGTTTQSTTSSDNTTVRPTHSTTSSSNTTLSSTETYSSVHTTNVNDNTNFNITTPYNTTTVETNNTVSVNTTQATTQSSEYSNATTTGIYNETVSNSTVESNTTIDNSKTEPKLTTTSGFWEPPIQNYDVPSRSNNVVIILIPVAGILLLVFVAAVVLVMCKRSRKAARRTMVPDTKNKADKNDNIKGRGYLEQNRTTSLTDKPEHHYLTKSEIDKRDAQYSNTTVRKEHNNTLNEIEVQNRLNGRVLANTAKPKPYQPSEWEKGLLDHLELSSIVIENDPCDPNRYFKKTDPVDWYRVIMKGKKPRDSDNLLNTTDETRKHSRKTKCRNSSIENETETKERPKKHRSNRSQSDLGFGESSMKPDICKSGKRTKDRYSSSDRFDNTISEHEHTINASRNTSQPRLVISKPANTQDMTHSSSLRMSQPKQVSNKPMKVQESMYNERRKTGEPRYEASNSGYVPESNPQPVPTRIISKFSTASMPSTEPRNEPKGVIMQISGKFENDTHFNRELSTSSSSNSSFSDTTPERNTHLRSSQTRSNLFNASSKLNSQHTSTDKEGEGKLAVKRPAIVPPLNLTGTGDKMARNNDGFEEFLLN